MTTKVEIIIVNFNGMKFIKDLLKSIEQQTLKPDKITIVDNASKDNSVKFIEKNYPQINLIKNSKNYGFAKGNNIALRQSDAKYVVLLNYDTIVDKNWLQELVFTLDTNPKVVGAQSKMYYSNHLLNSTGHKSIGWLKFTDRGANEKDEGQYDTLLELPSICAGSAIYRLAAIKKVGYFDEKFFCYVEDVDLNLRLSKLGSLIFCPKSIVIHLFQSGSSRTFPEFYTQRNTHLLRLKYLGFSELLRKYPKEILNDFRRSKIAPRSYLELFLNLPYLLHLRIRKWLQ